MCVVPGINSQETKLEAPNLKRILDDQEAYFNEDPDKKFDQTFFDSLLTCMAKNDDLLVKANDNAWKKGFIDYYAAGGSKIDYRGKIDNWGEYPTSFQEGKDQANAAMIGGIKIIQPCNYASNIAFYHSVMRICDYDNWHVDDEYQKNLKRGFATLAAGSSHMHGSHTALGSIFDNRQISIISYLAHQMSVQYLPGDSSILRQLSVTKRNIDSNEFTEQFITKLANNEVNDWAKFLADADYP